MSTLLNLRSRLRTELKVDPNGRIWSDATLDTALNQAVLQIQQDGDFDWHFNDAVNSETTVASTATYALPSDFVRLELNTVKYNSSSLEQVDYRWLFRTNSSLAVDGTPAYYYLRGTNIGLFKRPNDTLTLEYLYRSKLTAMSDDADDSGLPSDFDEAVTHFTCYLAWNDIAGKNDKAIESLQNYKLVMEGLYAQYLGRRDQGNFSFGFETTRDYTVL